jgi:hypothetical protein
VKHIKIANQSRDCHRCSSLISTGEFYFTKYLSGGRYMSEKTDYRLHIRCVTKDDLCCEDGGHELSRYLEKEKKS